MLYPFSTHNYCKITKLLNNQLMCGNYAVRNLLDIFLLVILTPENVWKLISGKLLVMVFPENVWKFYCIFT